MEAEGGKELRLGRPLTPPSPRKVIKRIVKRRAGEREVSFARHHGLVPLPCIAVTLAGKARYRGEVR
jgi:hypothetical protein